MLRSKSVTVVLALLTVSMSSSAAGQFSRISILTGENHAPSEVFNAVEGGTINTRQIDSTQIESFDLSLFTSPLTSVAPVDVTNGDVDGDGIDEVIVLTGTNTAPGDLYNLVEGPRVTIRKTNGNEVPNAGFSVGSPATNISIAPIAIAAANLDADPAVEIIVLTGDNTSPGDAANTINNAHVDVFDPDGTPVPGMGFSISIDSHGSVVPIAVAVGEIDLTLGREILVLTGTNTDPGELFNTVVGGNVHVRNPDGTVVPGTGFSVATFSSSFTSVAPIDLAAVDRAVGGRAIAVLTGRNVAPRERYNYVLGADVGVYRADGTAVANAGFSISTALGPTVGVALAAGNADSGVGDEIAVLTGLNSDPGELDNTVVGASVTVRNGTAVDDFVLPDIFTHVAPAPVAVSIAPSPCTNCNNGGECPGDIDGDGLKDAWEARGLDSDCDGDVDVDLPNLKGTGRGTNPQHKDVLVEVDYMQLGAEPTQAMVRVAKAMLRAAPDVAGNWPNPDGQPGVMLWMDTGTLRDPAGFEPSCIPAGPGATPCAGACDDNTDNDGDGQADAADSDCLGNFGMEGVGPCNDMIDNDRDGVVDAADADCFGRGPNGAEGVGFCNDGVDNDLDGLTDFANDPDCAVGDNLGRGGERVSLSSLPQGGVPHVADSSFYSVKQAFFDRASRQPIFHYALLGVGVDLTQGETGPVTEGSGGARSCEDFLDNDGNGLTDIFDPQCQTCLDNVDNDVDMQTDSDDPQCRGFAGGWAEVGGNDLIVYNTGVFANRLATGPDPGTFMHELGHNFHLDHGGKINGVPDRHNCKPNYVSIMNYQNQFGIVQAVPAAQFVDRDRDGFLDPFSLDYFPPRNQAGRSNFFPAGISITESALNESTVLDPTDADNFFQFGGRPAGGGAGVLTALPLQGFDLNGDGIPEIDWNGNGVPDMGTVAADLDSAVFRDCAGQTAISTTPLVAMDDWENMRFAFGEFPDAADGAHNPSQESGATTRELLLAQRLSNTIDLAMELSPPSSVQIGTNFDIDVVVRNEGPGRSVGLTAHIELPEGTIFIGSSANCQQYFADTLDCTLVDIYPGDVLAFPVTLRLTPASDGVPLLFAGQVSHPVADDASPSDNQPEVFINRPPVCDAGGPYEVECAGATTQLTLDGTGSSDPDGDSLAYAWSGAITPANAIGQTPTVGLTGLGSKVIALNVSDENYAVSCGTNATVSDTVPPTIVANPVTVTRCLPTTEAVSVTASATDGCSGPATLTAKLVFVAGKSLATPIALSGSPVSVALPPGEARIEWRAVDPSGNVSTVLQTVTVNVQETAAMCCSANMTQVQGTAGPDLILRPFSTPYCVFGLGALDNVVTGTGKDYIAGGAGNDLLDSGWSSADTVSGGTGSDWINLATGSLTTLYGGDGDDNIDANNAATIFGNAGDDYIDGLVGTHIIYPGPGKDTVHAGAGDDTIVIRNICELENQELLDGGLGNDTLITPVPVTELQARGVSLLGIQNVIIKADEQHLSQCF